MLVRGDTITHVGTMDPETIDAAQTFDTSGLHVTPGFIAACARRNLLETPHFRNAMAMGVTTVLLGRTAGDLSRRPLRIVCLPSQGPGHS